MASLGAGGLSGKPLRARATEVIRYLHRKSDGGLPIIGSGGIHSAADAREKLARALADSALHRLYLRRAGAGEPDKPEPGARLTRCPRTRRCHHMMMGTPTAVGHRKLYGKGIKRRLVTENADTAAMYEAMKPEMWLSSHWFLAQWPALA